MDHLTFAQLLGNYGEFVGAIAVVLTLGYLAVQIRQNTQATSAASEIETGRMWTEFLARFAESEDLAEIWDKGHTKEDELSPPEKRRFIWICAEYFSTVENLYRQRNLNFVSHETWSQHEAATAGMLGNPLVARWWVDGVTPFSPSFRATIDRARSELGDDAVWHYTPLAEL